MTPDEAKDRIRSIIRQAEVDYAYEQVDDDPPQIDWELLADDLCRMIDQLHEVANAE